MPVAVLLQPGGRLFSHGLHRRAKPSARPTHSEFSYDSRQLRCSVGRFPIELPYLVKYRAKSLVRPALGAQQLARLCEQSHSWMNNRQSSDEVDPGVRTSPCPR
jgi:hypothetical protein